MRLTELWKSATKPTLSIELFPARNEKAAAKLDKVIDKLAALEPDFVSVTFGAGGSTRDGSRQLIEKLMKEKGLEVVAYFAGYGLSPEAITEVLRTYRDLGVETVLAVRGDPPKEDEGFEPHPESFRHASELIEFIRERFDFCLGAAGYPEGHIEAESFERDLEFAKLKVEKGAEFLITNYTYDNDFFVRYMDRLRDLGVKVPILPGVMPIYNIKMMETLAKLCGASIPKSLRSRLDALPPGDKQALHELGVDVAVEQCRELFRKGAPGVHLYSMDRAKSVVAIVERLRSEGLL